MYVRPTAPGSIGEVIKDALLLYQASFARIWRLSLAGALVQGATNIYLTGQLTSISTSATTEGFTAAIARLGVLVRSPAVWFAGALIALVWMVTNAALITRQHAVATQQVDSNAAALGFVLQRLPRIIIAAVIWAVALAIATLLFVVPGIWLWGQLQLWLVVLCVEDLGAFGSLGKSWRLTERHWSRANAVVGLVAIVIVVVALCEDAVAGIAIAVFHSDVGVAVLISQSFSTLTNVFTAPIVTATLLAVYYDLQLRRDGLRARLNSLQPA